MDISNLSAGGTPVDVGEVMHQRWRDLAVRVARIFDLRICGVDLACKDITQSDSEYGVIEVKRNAWCLNNLWQAVWLSRKS